MGTGDIQKYLQDDKQNLLAKKSIVQTGQVSFHVSPVTYITHVPDSGFTKKLPYTLFNN